MSKTFNQLISGDPVCLMITTRTPIFNSFQKQQLRQYFQNKICKNRVNITDIAFKTTTFIVDHEDHPEFISETQQIFICFDNWICRKQTGDDEEISISFTQIMNEMSECFAHGTVIRCDDFLSETCSDIDMSDWIITYFDSIRSITEVL